NVPPAPAADFFGRPRELWHIERWFADGTRRITITGFGGQGKTALALEAGRWLTRAGLFHTYFPCCTKVRTIPENPEKK
ncbi:MAG TPA: hypothetical protein VN829_01480, partial [Dongiaceae bacterium]|nr:hypothetical protein [Dongiaceae bacterium]